jgi:hypothetical protein
MRRMEPNPAPHAPPNPMPHAVRRPLPPVSTFLREVLSLGVRSIGPAISALILLCFYRFGMGLYMEFAVKQTSPLGFPDERARAAYWILTASAYLPLLALVYTPFLPLQDAILRGGRKSFLNSVRQVLECMVPFGISSIVQVVILATPVFLMLVLATAALSSVPEAPKEVIGGTVLLLLIPACVWVAIAALFLLFATPALVLDGLGPIRSIRFSVAEVARHLWGIIGRLIAGGAMIVVGVVLASFPASMLAMAAMVSGSDLPALKIARVLWTSVVTALAFPFSVALLMSLYRAVAPAPVVGGAGDGGGSGGDGGGGEPRPIPVNPPPVAEPHKAETPYVFE